ncbi:hypothetical protein, partial [Plasmodium yoelii yoelii]
MYSQRSIVINMKGL